eukprot:824789_1
MLVHSGLRIVHNENDAADEVVPAPEVVSVPENGKAEAVDEPTNVDKVMRDVGNVTAETQMFFEYAVRKSEIAKLHEKRQEQDVSFPFQVQLEYTRLDGARCVRVLTQSQRVARSQDEAEQNANVGVLAANSAQVSAKLAQKGDYERSRVVNFSSAVYLDRIANTGKQQNVVRRYVRDVSRWDRVVQREQVTEEESGLTAAIQSSSTGQKSITRSRNRNDQASKRMFKMKSKAYRH